MWNKKAGGCTPPAGQDRSGSTNQSSNKLNLRIPEEEVKPFSSGPKILFWDVEIAPPIYWAYGPRVEYLRSDNIIRDKWFVCASWKWLGRPAKYTTSVLNNHKRFDACYFDDYTVIQATKEAIEQADVVVAHNGDNFDWKELQARCVFHGLGPLPPIQKIDTLKVARREFRFHSNNLRYLAEHLGVASKDEPPDWGKIALGDVEEIRKCTSYNRQDVVTLEAVYLKLMPYMQNHPNYNVYADIHHDVCPNCGSNELKIHKCRYTRVGKRVQYRCQACGAYMTSKKTIKSVNIR